MLEFKYVQLFLCYGILMISIIFLWIDPLFKSKIKTSWVLYLISVVFANIFGFINIIGSISLIIFGLLIYFQNKNKKYSFLSLVIFIFCILFMLHKIPGFNNFKLYDSILLSKEGLYYTMYLNFDKASMGFLLLAISGGLISNRKEIIIKKQIIIIIIGCLFTVIFTSNIFKMVKFDMKLSNILPIWLPVNLLFVCLAEEVFFRKFIQDNLRKLFSLKDSHIIIVIISSILFGVAHFKGGLKLVVVSSLAGVFYGYIYEKTKKIEYSILLHFLINLVHILLFTYPALKY